MKNVLTKGDIIALIALFPTKEEKATACIDACKAADEVTPEALDFLQYSMEIPLELLGI